MNGRINTHGTPVPSREREAQAQAVGPVRTYRLTPEEPQRYLNSTSPDKPARQRGEAAEMVDWYENGRNRKRLVEHGPELRVTETTVRLTPAAARMIAPGDAKARLMFGVDGTGDIIIRSTPDERSGLAFQRSSGLVAYNRRLVVWLNGHGFGPGTVVPLVWDERRKALVGRCREEVRAS